MENSTDYSRIQSFDLDTQVLLKTALKGQQFTLLYYCFLASFMWKINISKCSFFVCFLPDPGSVNLEKVSNIIVDQSLKDQVFSKEAGRICYTIVQVHVVDCLLGCGCCFVYSSALTKTLSTTEIEGFKKLEQDLNIRLSLFNQILNPLNLSMPNC